jgi:site-specific recombinase XerD
MRCDRIGSYEELPTKERAQVALDAFLADRLPAPAIPEKPVTKRRISRIVNEIAKRAEVLGVHPHRFRTTFATHMLRSRANQPKLKRMNELELMALLGHSNLIATQKYLALNNQDVTDSYRKFHPHA